MVRDDLPALLTAETFAEVIHVHANTVRRHCAEGKIPAQKIAGEWIISRDAAFAELIRKEEECQRQKKSAPDR